MVSGLHDKIQIFENQCFTVKYIKQVRRTIANTIKVRLKVGNFSKVRLKVGNFRFIVGDSEGLSLY
jgi:hypothetical protein